MAIKLRRAVSVNDPANPSGPEFVEVPFENRVTTHDGIQFHWAHNEKRSFLDDGVGVAHAASQTGDPVIQDILSTGDARS